MVSTLFSENFVLARIYLHGLRSGDIQVHLTSLISIAFQHPTTQVNLDIVWKLLLQFICKAVADVHKGWKLGYDLPIYDLWPGILIYPLSGILCLQLVEI